MLDLSVMFNCAYMVFKKRGGGSVPHAKMMLVPMNCFLYLMGRLCWQENLLTEQM